MLYLHNIPLHKKKAKAKRKIKLAMLVLTLFLLGLGFVVFDWIRSNLKDNNTSAGFTQAAVRSAAINVFSTPYFQFQTDKSWRAINEASQDNKRYVYRSFEGGLIKHELIVEIDDVLREVLANTQVSRVLPVEIVNNTLSTLGAISPHCQNFLPDSSNRRQQFIKYGQTEFPCDPDSSVYVVVVGIAGGNELIRHTTESGSLNYKISYRDSTFSPSGRPLANIINSFQFL